MGTQGSRPLARKNKGRQVEDSGYISALSFGLPPFGGVPSFGLRISKQEDGRKSSVEAAFSFDLNCRSGVTALAMTNGDLRVSK